MGRSSAARQKRQVEMDLDALKAATGDLMGMLKEQPMDHRARAQIAAAEEQAAEYALTPVQLAERQCKQVAHAAKLREQRADTARREAEAETRRREIAQHTAAKTPSVMGIGPVPVDIGDTCPAYHYELRYDEVDVLIRVPPGTPAKQLAVSIRD